jgi:hypothetical protein
MIANVRMYDSNECHGSVGPFIGRLQLVRSLVAFSCSLQYEDLALGLKTQWCALKRAILDIRIWCRHGGRYAAVSTDDTARPTELLSDQVCLVRQAMMPATLVLLASRGFIGLGIASKGGFLLDRQVLFAFKVVGIPSSSTFWGSKMDSCTRSTGSTCGSDSGLCLPSVMSLLAGQSISHVVAGSPRIGKPRSCLRSVWGPYGNTLSLYSHSASVGASHSSASSARSPSVMLYCGAMLCTQSCLVIPPFRGARRARTSALALAGCPSCCIAAPCRVHAPVQWLGPLAVLRHTCACTHARCCPCVVAVPQAPTRPQAYHLAALF